jgi:hypothetical protein
VGRADTNLSDLDVQVILKVAARYVPGTPLQMVQTKCWSTIEKGCSREVHLAYPTSDELLVSEIDGSWVIGACQREGIARRTCLAAVDHKWEIAK